MTTDLDAAIAEAARQMHAATAGAAVCAITRSGASAPAAKYYEGRWAALSELRRRLAAEPLEAGVPGPLLDRWAADLEARTSAGAGPDWIAYLTGGVDTLAEMAGPDTDGTGGDALGQWTDRGPAEHH
jgi:hypothetical protein